MSSITDFYNTLLSTEIAVFGIIAAAFFVFAEMVYGQLSYRGVSAVFRSRLLWFSIVLSGATFLFTATGSLILSFPSFDFVPQFNFGSRPFFQNGYAGFTALASFLLSIGLFVVLVIRNGKYLRPSRVALLVGRQVTPRQIRDYLLQKYGVPNPDDYPYILRLFKSVGMSEPIVGFRVVGAGVDLNEIKSENKVQIDERQEIVAEKLASYRKEYKQLIKKNEQKEDPLAMLSVLLIRAMDSFDIGTVEEGIRVISNLSKSFINAYGMRSADEPWHPDDRLTVKYVEDLLLRIRMYYEHCDTHHYEYARLSILEIAHEIALLCADKNLSEESNEILRFWKKIADESIGRMPRIFSGIMRYYEDVFHQLINNPTDDHKKILDEIYRHIGWLGERVLEKVGVQERPLMVDFDYDTEYDSVINTVLSLAHPIEEKTPHAYPLIYFDAVEVVFRQLVRISQARGGTSGRGRLKDNLFSLVHKYISFARVAIRQGNSKGAELGVFKGKNSYEHLRDNGLDEIAEDLIEALAELGGDAAGAGDRLERMSILNKNIPDYIIDVIVSSSHKRKLNSAAIEIVIKGEGDSEKRWTFLKKLGLKLQTNFGLNFDWRTGEFLS
jgi:hypothetical protein